MGLKIVNLYKDLPEMLEKFEKERVRKNNVFLDTLYDKVKKANPALERENIMAISAIISNYLNFEVANSHEARQSVQRIEEYNLNDKLQDLFNTCSSFAPKDAVVYVSLSNPKHRLLKKIKGVSGVTEKKNILLLIWPYQGWHTKVLEVFLHELTHIARANKIKNADLLEYIIAEGIAQSVAFEVLDIPNKMRVPSEMKLWSMYKENLNITSKKKIHKLVYGDHRKIPILAGYFMGYRIVQNYLAKTGKKASEIITKSAKEILETSDYSKK